MGCRSAGSAAAYNPGRGDRTVRGSARLRLARDVTYQSLGSGQDTVILSLDSGCLYTCNETTCAFLLALDGERTLDGVVRVLEEQFDAPPETLREDMAVLADELMREKLVVAVGD